MYIFTKLKRIWTPLTQRLEAPRRGIVLAMSKEVGETADTRFKHRCTVTCGCGAQLKIRSTIPHDGGPSNFYPYPNTKDMPEKLRGASRLPVELLTWAGMVEERGWKVHSYPNHVECPACQRGLTMREFKDLKRRGKLV